MLDGWTFRRGLVEAIWLDASVFLDRAADLFAAFPTLTVAKLKRAAGHLPELAASPWLAHLRGLDLSGNDITGAALACLTASRNICLVYPTVAATGFVRQSPDAPGRGQADRFHRHAPLGVSRPVLQPAG
ncbi:MAG TPA: hypothetical protein VKD90_07795 [Gemmataceae bacterium]|nr:hypothetical protein [Gemmataceae bacterium]